MTINLLSISLSFFLNLIFLALMMIGLTFSVHKKEEIKITLLEPLAFERVKPEVVAPEVAYPEVAKPEVVKPKELKPVKPLSTLKESAPPKEKLVKPPLEKKSNMKEKSEEAWLNERLSALEKSAKLKRGLKEDEEFLRKRLYSLQGKVKEKEDLGSEVPQSLSGGKGKEIPSSAPSSKLSEEYLLLIKRKLQTHFEVPIYLKNRGDLSALVEIQVNPSGEIHRVSFLKRGDDEAFNRAIEKCLKAVNPLPVERDITLRIEFKAQGISVVR
ncbi:MAG: TonB C-terminal domain-containing protein [Caldimicrobium sp.]